MNMTKSRLLTLCVWIGLLCRVVAAPADEPHFRRWAVLSAPEVAATGLPDLLTVELSQKSFELVEREQIEAVAKEIELSKLLAADGAARRLKVGQLVKADALVLLSLVEHDKKRFVKLVISDCRYGSRLRLEHFPFPADGVELLVQKVCGAVEESRKRFAGGVGRIVAVLPFVSRNLTHDFDHLQAGYSVLLQTSLADAPGIAVLEVEEARQILRELSLTGTVLGERRVPVFVEGEFEVLGTAKKNSFRLAVDVVGAKADRQRIEKSGLTSDEVINHLTRSLPTSLLQLMETTHGAPLSREQQFERLAQRAQVMAEANSFRHSTELREAALLLQPQDVGERIALIQESLLLSLKLNHGDEIHAGEKYQFQDHQKLFEIAGGHLDFLLSNRLVNRIEAAYLLRSMSESTGFLFAFRAARQPLPSEAVYHQIGGRLWPLLSQLDFQLRDGQLHPRFRDRSNVNPRAPVSRYLQQHLCAKVAIRWEQAWIESQIPEGRKVPGDSKLWLNHVERLFDEVFPQDYPLAEALELVVKTLPDTLTRLKVPDSEQSDFLNRLRKQKGAAGWCGRVGELSARGDSAKTPADMQSLLNELLRLRAEFTKMLAASECDDRNSAEFAVLRILETLEDRWSRKRLVMESPKGKGAGEGLVKKHSLPRNLIPEPAPQQRVLFRPLGIPAPWIGWKRCHDSLDVAWTHTRVDVIQPGKPPRTIFSVNLPDRLIEPTWDGEVFWIPSIQKGIQLISATGETVAKLPLAPAGNQPSVSDAKEDVSNTLPRFDAVATFPETAWKLNRGPWPTEYQGLLPLWPIAPGRCLALGLIGREKRVWIAELRRTKANPKSVTARVIHTAGVSFDPTAMTDSHCTFKPKFAFELRRDPQRTLLIGRTVGIQDLPPLLIDLQTLSVSVPAAEPTPKLSHDFYITSGDRVLGVGTTALDLLVPGESLDSDWKRSQPFPNQRYGDRLWGVQPRSTPFQDAAGRAVIPNRHWSRVDLQRETIEELTTQALPFHQRFQFCAASAVYGVVAWNLRDQLYQVLIDQPWDEWNKIENEFPFVPKTRRQEHAAAVQRIQELGGRVGTHWGWSQRFNINSTAEQTWETIVYLPAQWRGGDEQLALLKDLHQLADVRLVQAPITNAGMRTIGQLAAVNQLRLVETKITDEGLAFLKSPSKVVFLHLEGTTNGNGFSDQGLEHVRHLSNLRTLFVYGPAFTDDGLKALAQCKALRGIHGVSTTISPQGKKHLVTIPDLQLSDHSSFPNPAGTETE